jgi:hypothetical protein
MSRLHAKVLVLEQVASENILHFPQVLVVNAAQGKAQRLSVSIFW